MDGRMRSGIYIHIKPPEKQKSDSPSPYIQWPCFPMACECHMAWHVSPDLGHDAAAMHINGTPHARSLTSSHCRALQSGSTPLFTHKGTFAGLAGCNLLDVERVVDFAWTWRIGVVAHHHCEPGDAPHFTCRLLVLGSPRNNECEALCPDSERSPHGTSLCQPHLHARGQTPYTSRRCKAALQPADQSDGLQGTAVIIMTRTASSRTA